ncbi:MAG: hypothetical protein JXM75_11715 [Chromatiaceae bacterium]|nr:hypothetical protein [Chromatiaceae bacterium]
MTADAFPLMRQRLAQHASEIARLAAGLADQQRALRDTERSLLERISNLDDDRRLTASQLQRAWKSQREDLRAQRRHGSWRLGAVLLLAVGLAGSAFLWVDQRLDREGMALDARLAEMQQHLDLLSRFQTQDARIQDQIAELATALDALSGMLAELPTAAPQQPQAVMMPVLVEQLESATQEQQRLTAELQALESRLAETAAAPQEAETPAVETQAPPTRTQDTMAITDRPHALQLLGAFSREEILAFSRREDLPEQLFLREERYQGRPWFALIHSLHGSREAALEARANLPPALARLDPWVRELPPGSRLDVLDRTGAGFGMERGVH